MRLTKDDKEEGEDEEDEEDINDVEVIYGVIGLPNITRHLENDNDVFGALLQASEVCAELVSTDAMRAAIAFKWHRFGRTLWHQELVLFGLFFTCYVAGVYLLIEEEAGHMMHTPDSKPYVGIGLYATASLINVRYAYHEAVEFAALGMVRYMSSTLNVWDLLLIVNVFVLGVLLALESSWSPVLGSLGTVLMLPKMASISRGSASFSMLVAVLQEALKSMGPFLSLMSFVIFANAFAFEILSDQRAASPYRSVASSWFTAFALMLGEFELDTYNQDPWMYLFFHYFAVFVNIVLLNVLIAIISDAFEDVQNTGTERILQQRGELIVDLEAHLHADHQEQDGDDYEAIYPPWVHVLARADETVSSRWQGRVRELKQSIARVEHRVAETQEAIFKKIDSEMSKMKDELHAGLQKQRNLAMSASDRPPPSQAPSASAREPGAKPLLSHPGGTGRGVNGHVTV